MLPAETVEAMKALKRARLAVRHAEERLIAELPDNVASELHYNGHHANVPAEYAKVKKLMLEDR